MPSNSQGSLPLPPQITGLVDWALRHGAHLHPDIQVYHDPSTGLSLRVNPDAAAPLSPSTGSGTGTSTSPHEPVVRLPVFLSLSYLNAVSDKNPGTPLSKTLLSSASSASSHPAPTPVLPPHVLGRLFLVREYLAGATSFWAPYIRALPQPDDPAASWRLLPPFWDADDAELLDGTNVEVGLARVRADLRAEVAAVTAILQAERAHDEEECSSSNKRLRDCFCPDLYHWAYAIFSSRSFRPSLVLADEQCRGGGDASRAGDFSVLLPLFDLGNHDMTASVRWERCRSPTSPQSQEEGKEEDVCEFHVDRTYQPGEQVFNNYGLKTNAELLLGYGFMIPPTQALHNDYIHVRKRAPTTTTITTASSTPVGTSDEYLISARPVQHPSSVLARARLSFPPVTTTTALEDTTHIAPAFQHVHPDMVWDIFASLTACPATRRRLIPVTTGAGADADENQRRALFLAGRVDGECLAYFAQTAAVIQHKVLQELERLDETDVCVPVGLTTCQRLALDYRRQCRAVLEGTLETMNTDQTLAAAADESS